MNFPLSHSHCPKHLQTSLFDVLSQRTSIDDRFNTFKRSMHVSMRMCVPLRCEFNGDFRSTNPHFTGFFNHQFKSTIQREF